MPNSQRKLVAIFIATAALGTSACTRETGRKAGNSDQNTTTTVGNAEESEGKSGTYRDSSYSGDARASRDMNTGEPPSSSSSSTSAVSESAAISLDLQQFPFEKRAQFRAVMDSLLENLDKGIASLTTSSAARVPGTEKLEAQQNSLEQRLSQIDALKPDTWEKFKTTFRDDVSSLESQYQSVARNRR